jgi:hypothetical protein
VPVRAPISELSFSLLAPRGKTVYVGLKKIKKEKKNKKK